MVTIRIARADDADRLAAISRTASGTPGSDPSAAISDSDRLVLVAELDDAIVGWAKTHHYLQDSGSAIAGHYLGGVNVHPEFRRRAIGSDLTRARLAWIGERASDAWFFTNSRNVASIALHARLGFAEVARSSEFHGVTFDGGVGLLFHATL